MRSSIVLRMALLTLPLGSANGAEVTIKNDSVSDFSSVQIQAGFVAGEKAAAWLTSTCNGNIRALQIFWRSQSGTAPQEIHSRIEVLRNGTFPIPGAQALDLVGPLLTDSNSINEYRYLDTNQTIPISVPVTLNETFVVSFQFDHAPPGTGPSITNDVDGCQANRNSLYANFPVGSGSFIWFNSCALGVDGDWVIRAVVDCQAGAQNTDLAVNKSAAPELYTPGQALTYTVIVSNAGPASAANATLVDIFPPAFTNANWTCVAGAGATCPVPAAGTGNITQAVSLAPLSQLTFTANGTVANGTTGLMTNSATILAGPGATDPVPGNNTHTINTAPLSDRIFAHNFDGP